MSNGGNSLAKRDFQYQDIGIVQFDVQAYLNNEAMIRRLYSDVTYYEGQYRASDDQLKITNTKVEVLKVELRKEQEKYETRDKEASQTSLIQSILVLIGSTLLAFGVGIAISASNDWPGWVLSVAGVMLQIFALGIPFLSKLQERKSNGQNQTTSAAASERTQ